MKSAISFLIIIASLIFLGCQKEAPLIATDNELSVKTLSESFMVQPINIDNGLVSIVNKNDEAILCSYDLNGIKNWQQSLEGYLLNGQSVHQVPYLALQKDADNQILINMFHLDTANSVVEKKQYIKTIKFSESGNFIWQLQDTIHQPDTIIIGTDTIDVSANIDFQVGGFLSLSNGTYSIISSQMSRTAGDDSTYLQMSNYDNSGQFIDNHYLKMTKRWTIESVHVTSDDNILIFCQYSLGNRTLKMINFNGDILFEINPSQNLFDINFFYENNQGNYVISAAYFENTDVAKGIVFCIDKNGNPIWNLPSQIAPGSGFMRSVYEQNDGYLFSGFASSSALFDWRSDEVNSDYKAIIQKIDKTGNSQWDTLLTNNFNSTGAGVIVNNNISFFLGKKDGPIKNVVLLKLDMEGKIKN